MTTLTSKFLPNPKTIASKLGVDRGPIHLVEAGLITRLEELGWHVLFDGHHQFEEISAASDPPVGKLKNPRLVSRVCESVANAVGTHVRNGPVAGHGYYFGNVEVGPRHSSLRDVNVARCSSYPDACVIWVDAHADINTAETTSSGIFTACPVSFLLGLGEKIPEYAWSVLVYIGLRDLDAGEKRILRENNIKAFSMHEVDKYGIGRVMDMALDHVNPNRDLPIHLSFDVDALDPSVAPSTGTPVRGGLTFREGHYICEVIYETGLLVALDLMEVNPSLADPESVRQTVAVGCSLVCHCTG
ncbi:Ureohydrolase [Pisolithus croceorrhizus]|nr:Ureohydrolase [Pisolithus croceorrhizus]